MTAKRFEFREINELPILPKCYDTEKQEYANLFECVGWLNELYRENEQLKQRNNRQAKQLDNLYHLIEKQDWKTLNGLIQEFQECEEQLQREWRTYE